MLEKVREYIKENDMLALGDKVVVGVSGGADSTALLEILDSLKEEYGLSIYVVHINHGIRKEAGEDAEFVRMLCEKKSLPFYLFCEDIPAMAKREGLSEEEAGRSFRYQCFYKVMRENGAHKLAVAHHMDDQAETVLFHLVRGTDLAGAAGIQPVSVLSDSRNIIIRPLLNVRGAEIRSWLTAQGIHWQEDATNNDDNYSRNRIRNRVMSDLTVINDRASEHISEFAKRAFLYDGYIKKQAMKFIAGEVQVVCSKGDKAAAKAPLTEPVSEVDIKAAPTEPVSEVDIKAAPTVPLNEADRNTTAVIPFSEVTDCMTIERLSLQREHLLAEDRVLADRVLYELFTRLAGAKKDITGEHVNAIYGLLSKQSGRRLNLPYGVVAEVSYEWLILERMGDKCKRDCITATDSDGTTAVKINIKDLKIDEDLSIKISDKEKIVLRLSKTGSGKEAETGSEISTQTELKNFPENCEKFEKNYTKYFDCDTIGNTLYIRCPKQEDYFICDGEGHRKKLSRYFKDIKLPAGERGAQRVLADGSEVLLVLGRRRCESHLVTADTQRVLTVDYVGTE